MTARREARRVRRRRPSGRAIWSGWSIRTLRRETNRSLGEAIGLHRAAGYREVPVFHDEPYAHLWFEKTLKGSDRGCGARRVRWLSSSRGGDVQDRLAGYPAPTQRLAASATCCPAPRQPIFNSEPALPKKLDEGGQLGSGLASARDRRRSKAGSSDSPS